MSDLADLQAEILREAPRRVGGVGAQTVQDALVIDTVEGDRIAGATVGSAEAALAWLREQALVKTEDGVEYPMEAYALILAEDDPDAWDLRMWEGGKVSRRMIDRAAAHLSPGGYNGNKTMFLEGSGAEDMVKYKLRSAYQELGVSESDMSRWVKDNFTRELLLEFTPLTEASVSDKGEAAVVVIKPGFNSSRSRYYPADMLKRDHLKFNNVKMYADHPTEAQDQERPERSVKDWVANLVNVRMGEEGAVIGDAIITAPWFKEKLGILRDKQLLSEMGVSINAIGKASIAKVEGVKTALVDGITRARSVDFVTEAGAKGGVLLYENSQAVDVDFITVDVLRERRPDLVDLIEADSTANKKREDKMSEMLEAQVKTLTEEKAAALQERDEAMAQVKTAEDEKAKAEAKAVIEAAITEATLPDPSKARLRAQFAEATSADGVAEAVKAEQDYVAELGDLGKVKNMGESKRVGEDNTEELAKLRESTKRAFPEWTEPQLDKYLEGR